MPSRMCIRCIKEHNGSYAVQTRSRNDAWWETAKQFSLMYDAIHYLQTTRDSMNWETNCK